MRAAKYGSLERYLLELSKICNQRGYTTVLQYEEQPSSKEYVSDLDANGIERRITRSAGVSRLRAISNLVKLIRSVKPEVITTHFVHDVAFLFAPVVAKLFGVRRIVHIQHSIGDFEGSSYMRRFVVRMVFDMHDCVLGVSSAVSDDILCTGVDPQRVSTHYLGLFGKREKSSHVGVELRAELGIPEDADVYACIAFDTPFKGLDILMDALARVVRKHPGVHVMMVGVDPDKSSLPKQAADLGLDGHVHWAGIRNDGWKLLNAADAYVQPSRFGEGLSLAIMEALSFKLPVIATRTAGNPEAVIDGKTGYLCNPGDIDDLANALERSLDDQTNWATIGEEGYKLYQRMFLGPKSIETLAERLNRPGIAGDFQS